MKFQFSEINFSTVDMFFGTCGGKVYFDHPFAFLIKTQKLEIGTCGFSERCKFCRIEGEGEQEDRNSTKEGTRRRRSHQRRKEDLPQGKADEPPTVIRRRPPTGQGEEEVRGTANCHKGRDYQKGGGPPLGNQEEGRGPTTTKGRGGG